MRANKKTLTMEVSTSPRDVHVVIKKVSNKEQVLKFLDHVVYQRHHDRIRILTPRGRYRLQRGTHVWMSVFFEETSVVINCENHNINWLFRIKSTIFLSCGFQGVQNVCFAD